MQYIFVARNGKKEAKSETKLESDGKLEQRHAPRREVRIDLNHGYRRSLIANLSATGALVVGLVAQMNSEIDLLFSVPSEKLPIRTRARVVRILSVEEDQTERTDRAIAVQFTEISQEDRVRLGNYLKDPVQSLHVTDLEAQITGALFSAEEIDGWASQSIQTVNLQKPKRF